MRISGPAEAGRRRIYLMRHGHVDYFDPDILEKGGPRMVRLTEEGRAQAEAAAEALSGASLDVAICSGLPRTRETAEIVLRKHPGVDLHDVEQLEEIESGTFYTEDRHLLAARLRYVMESAAVPGATFLDDGERFSDAYDRVSSALTRLLTEGEWRTALIAGHEGVNRLALSWACAGGLPSVSTFEQDLACVNVLDFDITPAEAGEGVVIERVIIKTVNATPYDYLKHGMAKTSLEALFDI